MTFYNDDEVLPFDINGFYETVADNFKELKVLLDNARTDTEQENKMIRDKLFDYAKDPTKYFQLPKVEDAVPPNCLLINTRS